MNTVPIPQDEQNTATEVRPCHQRDSCTRGPYKRCGLSRSRSTAIRNDDATVLDSMEIQFLEFQTSEAAPKEQNINSLENNDATASGSVEIQEPGVVVDLRLNSALTAIILEVVGCTITAK